MKLRFLYSSYACLIVATAFITFGVTRWQISEQLIRRQTSIIDGFYINKPTDLAEPQTNGIAKENQISPNTWFKLRKRIAATGNDGDMTSAAIFAVIGVVFALFGFYFYQQCLPTSQSVTQNKVRGVFICALVAVVILALGLVLIGIVFASKLVKQL